MEDSGTYRTARELGAHDARLESLEKIVAEMNGKIDRLVSATERSKGAIWVLLGAGSVLTTIIAGGVAEVVRWLHGGQP